MLLSPEQFARLTEYASYSSHKLVDILVEFQPDGMFFKYLSNDLQTIDFDGFTHFINCYFGAELPSDLIQQLFLSFAHNANSAPSTSERRPSIFEEALSSTLNSVKNVFQVFRENAGEWISLAFTLMEKKEAASYEMIFNAIKE
uniref:Diacylglycerol kinase type I N-terminal domain-containing protein n=1 Tax=Ditylenchus dipsaci TaxID=166011 RepID=A0A915EH21_9BILA